MAGTAWRFCVFLLFGLAYVPGTRAADLFLNPQPSNIWLITLGDQLTYSPRFPGSGKYGIGAFPSFSVRRLGEPEYFGAPDDSINFPIFATDSLQLGPSGGVDMGRYHSQDLRLVGINNVPWGIEAGAFAQYWPIVGKLRLKAEARYGFGFDGVVASLGGDWVENIGQFTFALGPRVEIADDNYMRRYFGVTTAQSLANGKLPAYSIGAGVKSAGVAGEIGYRWSEEWKTTLFGRYDRLVSDAAKSPIVTKLGTPDQFTVGLQVEYTFRSGY